MRGVRRHGAGWQTEVRVVGHPRSLRQFPLDTDPAVMQAWRKHEQARLRLSSPRATKGTFAADAKRYLALVTLMPSYRMRVRDINVWVERFGVRSRSSITSLDIRAQRDEWARRGPKRIWQKHADRYGGEWVDIEAPLAASTVNHRLRALAHLYTVLDGPYAPNPARDVPELEEPDEQPRGLPYITIEKILAELPDRGRGLKGEKRAKDSLTKVRLRVMAYTGLAHRDVMRLRPTDLDLPNALMRAPRRRKGKGAPGHWIPLLPEAVDALEDFAARQAWGQFSPSSMRRSFLRACRKLNLSGIRPYDLRHSLLSLIAEATQDERAVQEYAGHGDIRTTRRYTEASLSPRLNAAAIRIREALKASKKAE